MTVSSSTAKVSYSGNGSTQAFAVPFYFLANSQLLVVLRSSTGVETTQVLGTNYTVTGAGVLTGGTVTMTVAPASGTTLVISRNVPLTQETDLQPNDRLPAETLEQSIDKLTMIAQQIDEATDRTLKYPLTDSSSISSTLPTSSERAGKYLAFSNTGAPIVAAIPPGSVNVRTFGATGDGLTDDTAAIQAAINASDAVFFPTGTYLVSSAINLKTNSNVFGEGASSVILYAGGAASQGALYVNSGSATAFVDNVTIRDLKVLGRVSTLGFNEFIHNISLSGVRNCLIERCVVEGFRGDGIYIGSGNVAGQERHNINVTIRDCVIDGLIKDNRNGISIIDCNGLNIDNNYITRASRPTMPGAIDIEPDGNAYHVIKDISIRNNKIFDCSGNVASIGVFLPYVVYTTPPSGFVFENNYIDNPNAPNNNLYGFFFQYGSPFTLPSPDPAITESTHEFGIRIKNNFVKHGTLGRAFVMWNCNDVVMEGNEFVGGAVSYIGWPNTQVFDFTLKNNTFVDVRNSGDYAVSIFNVDRLTFEGNIFKDCGAASGAARGAIEFNTGTTSYVKVLNNVCLSPGGFTVQFVRDAGHTFTPATNVYLDNTVLVGTNQFPALYNDVKETAWTPIVEGGGSAGTGTYTQQYGVFRQVGNMVFFRLKVAVSAGHTGTGVIEASLPTPVQPELNNEEYMCAANADGVSSTGGIIGFINPAAVVGGNGCVRFYQTTTGTTGPVDIPAGAFTLYATGYYVRA